MVAVMNAASETMVIVRAGVSRTVALPTKSAQQRARQRTKKAVRHGFMDATPTRKGAGR
jgi:hypothetical protein